MISTENRELIIIEASELPSGKYQIGLVEPTFKDRRDAARRLPSNPDSRVGYSLEQLLLSMSILEVNNQPVREDPRDPICNIRYLAPEDSQYLLTTFLEAFTLSEELADDVRAFSKELKDSSNIIYTIPKDKMPCGLFSVTFRAPSTGDQIDIDRRYPGADSNCGYSSEEMLFAAMLTHIDGKEITERPKEIISIIDSWFHIDAQYALAAFLNINYLNKEQRLSAKDLGKQLRTRGVRTTSSAPI